MKHLLHITFGGLFLLVTSAAVLSVTAQDAHADHLSKERIIHFFRKLHNRNAKALRIIHHLPPRLQERVLHLTYLKFPELDSDFDGVVDIIDRDRCESDANADGIIDGDHFLTDAPADDLRRRDLRRFERDGSDRLNRRRLIRFFISVMKGNKKAIRILHHQQPDNLPELVKFLYLNYPYFNDSDGDELSDIIDEHRCLADADKDGQLDGVQMRELAS